EGGGPRLPADGDRDRAVPAAGAARRERRSGARDRAVRGGDADDRAARGGARAGRPRDDRGAVVTDLSFEPADAAGDQQLTFPAALPVLPLKETVVFPQSVSPLAIGQERSVKLVDDVVAGERMLALVTVRDSEIEEPGWDDLHEVGTAAVVHKMIRVPDGTLRILVQGVGRVRLERRVQDEPYLIGEF